MTIKDQVKKILFEAGASGEIELLTPPKPEMGDLSFACFDLAKELKKNPVEVAKELAAVIASVAKQSLDHEIAALPAVARNDNLIEKVQVMGPYLNFYLNSKVAAELILKETADKNFGKSKSGKGKKIMVEYAHPNTHKPVHIGHLRNITTGESLCRIFENAGYKVARVNYQGDVGLHIAKCLWGIEQLKTEYEQVRKGGITAKAEFLGRAYAKGGQAYEESEDAKKAIAELNEKIYKKDKEVYKIYKETRQWSLEYFDTIYKRVGAKFDRLYFESETAEPGKKLVLANLKKGIFKASQGAVIFEGEKYGLHSRVFLNQKVLPTYEAKDLALAGLQLKEYKPDMIYHVVAKEQTEYFRVLFKALELVYPKSIGKEKHLVYGWVSLKEGKMSSRTGNVVLAEWLLDEVKTKIFEVMKDHEMKDKPETIEKIAIAAVKYAFLRTGVLNDIVFNIQESVNLTGDSGPYLLYIIARIKSILKKAEAVACHSRAGGNPGVVAQEEKVLLLRLADFPEVCETAAANADPSKIAHYLLDLAQSFNVFYNACPVLKAENEETVRFRLQIISAVERVMTGGLYLLGVEAVEEM
ncbi:MAG: arginine--tRNA ligase [bacterium]|nr:arginine--tRNA ligase [bacterium]